MSYMIVNMASCKDRFHCLYIVFKVGLKPEPSAGKTRLMISRMQAPM